jgi:hypothetical protein
MKGRICPFCFPDKKLIECDCSIQGITSKTCGLCKSIFFYRGYDEIGWQFMTNYKENKYWIRWNNIRNKTVIVKHSNYGGWVDIISFDGEQHLTPNNIAQRLPTILVFM